MWHFIVHDHCEDLYLQAQWEFGRQRCPSLSRKPGHDTSGIHSTPPLNADTANQSQHPVSTPHLHSRQTLLINPSTGWHSFHQGPDLSSEFFSPQCSWVQPISLWNKNLFFILKSEMWLNIQSGVLFNSFKHMRKHYPTDTESRPRYPEYTNQYRQHTQHTQGDSSKSEDKQAGANLSPFVASPGPCHNVGGRSGKNSHTCSQTSDLSN